MTSMLRMLVACAGCLPLAAQGVQDMTMIVPFIAGQRLTAPHAEPRGWLDDSHYAVFDAERAGEKRSGWFRVDASSGNREPMFALGSDFDALSKLPGVRAEALRSVLGDADAYIWNDDHSAFLLNTASDLLWFDLASGAARRLTASPSEEVGEQFSPDGRLVSFIQDYNLFVVDTASGSRPRPLADGGHEDLFFGRLDWVYQEELYGRGNFKGHWWSPDSTRIALFRLDESPVTEFTLASDTPTQPTVEVSNYPKAGAANPKVDLGVVDVFGGAIRYFDLSRYGDTTPLLVRVTWHPDGKEVFFQVQDREQTWLEMLAGDVDSGEVRLVFREESDCWIESGPEPVWLADGKSFLWLSERDGREHVYHYGVDGRLIRRVTEGEFDVEEIAAVDEENNRMFVVTDRTDPKELHLWRFDLDGGEAEQITQRSGWHDVELSPDRAHYLDEFSALDYRLSRAVHKIDGGVVRSIVESDMSGLDPFGLTPPEFHKVEARDGFVMEAILIKPRGYVEGQRYPVLCHTYSGPHAPRALNRWRWRDYLWHQLIAQKGYMVWICDNRSASGKGRKAAKACWRDMGTSEMRDLEDGVAWLVDRGLADPKRVGIWGWSYGGYQTCFNLTHSKVWKLGIAVNPVTDWKFYDTIYTERYMGMPQTNREGYARASVLEAAANLHGDLLLVHATMDDNVHMQNSLQLAHALQQANKQFRFMAYPRVRHGIGDLRQQVHLFQMMTDFVVEKL